MRRCLAGVLAVGLLLPAAPSMANSCRDSIFAPFRVTTPPDNPRGLAQDWLPQFERFLNAVPALSPREEAWLNGELFSGDRNRLMRAREAPEFHQRAVRQDAESLVRYTRQALAATDRMQQVRWWLRLQGAVMHDVSQSIGVLTAQRQLNLNALPDIWRLPGPIAEVFEPNHVRLVREMLARDIGSCTVPVLLDLPLPGTLGFQP